jgi:hypothetical protein
LLVQPKHLVVLRVQDTAFVGWWRTQ